MFGQHVKFIVSQTLALVREDDQSASASSTLPNAFEVLIASQKAVDKATLPLKIQERTSCSMTLFPILRVRDGTADLVKVSESSYPMCSVCNQTKEHIKRRKCTVR